MNASAAVARQIKDITREANELSEETEGFIDSNSRPAFEHEVNALKYVLIREGKKSHEPQRDPIGFPGTFPQLTEPISRLKQLLRHNGSHQYIRLKPKWKRLFIKCETLGRRIDLLSIPDEPALEQTLWWMTERGGEDDLVIIERVRPFIPAECGPLVNDAEHRIKQRLSRVYRQLQEFFDLSEDKFARMIGVPGWKSGQPLPPAASQKLEVLKEIKRSLQAQFTAEETARWLHTPNPRFSRRTPVQAMYKGEMEQVLGMLVRLEEGIPN